MNTTSFRSKLNGSKCEDSDNQNAHNLIKLTTQVERLTQVLNMKNEEVEMLTKQLMKEQSCAKPKEIEDLISTVEEQTKEIENWSEKYQNLQYQNQQLQKKNTELEQIVSLLQNNTTQQYINYNGNQNSLKEIQSKRSSQYNTSKFENQYYQEDFNQKSNQSLQIQQDEINELKFKISQLQQELLDEKLLHKELITAEEIRVRDQERKAFYQYKQDTQNQLQLYKNQIDALQKMLESSQNVDKKDISYSQFKEKNQLFPEKSNRVVLLNNEDQDKKTIPQYSQYSKPQKESIIQVQSYKSDNLPNYSSQSIRIAPQQNTSFSLEGAPNDSQFNPNKISQIQEQINLTMAQIEKSIIQVDLMKQTNQVHQKIFHEQIQPSVTNLQTNSQLPQQQLSYRSQENQKVFSTIGQQSNNFNQFNQKQYF